MIILYFFLQSCKTEKKNDKPLNLDNKQFKTIISKPTFEEKLKKEPKLFLKFWSGMTEYEFQKVVDILNEENILSGKYKYGSTISMNSNIFNPIKFLINENCYCNIYPNFDSSNVPKLVSIELLDLTAYSNCLYRLYKEKYGLPSLLTKSEIDSEYVENNPNYSPKMSYTNENNELVFLNEVFNDKISSIKNIKQIQKENYSTSNLTYLLSENPIIINKDSNVIVISQDKYEFKSYIYSLEKSQAFKNYQKDISIVNFSFNKWLHESKFIETNSKLRTVSLKSEYRINAIYMSIHEYNNKIKERMKVRKNQIKDSLETEKRKNEKLLKSIESL
ncbi:hypothetical protein IU405_03025 [Polaribacter sp. BAL334]|uniref:hypothetical protein n=1 Tax=Polaribacter sp. BAL334 TaxID=1708178 RepID=UPI0018D233F6|nr:hypothetical protein [Polaribacter sp. BAL334]MBG7611212.1 hypothetical protein [Polaribacter sp. BAL334]